MATKKIKDGLLVEYLSNGEVESKENYKNGKLDGKSIYWHENGQKSSEALYKNGLKEGVSTCILMVKKKLKWILKVTT